MTAKQEFLKSILAKKLKINDLVDVIMFYLGADMSFEIPEHKNLMIDGNNAKIKIKHDIGIKVGNRMFHNTGIYSLEFQILNTLEKNWQILFGISRYRSEGGYFTPGCCKFYQKNESVGYSNGGNIGIQNLENLKLNGLKLDDPNKKYLGYGGLEKFNKDDYVGIIVDTKEKTLRYARNNKIMKSVIIQNIPNDICIVVGKWAGPIECQLIRSAKYNMFS